MVVRSNFGPLSSVGYLVGEYVMLYLATIHWRGLLFGALILIIKFLVI